MKDVKSGMIRDFFKEVFSAVKCPESLSVPVIDGLLETSLRGVDSHGIRLMPHYVEAALAGRINLSPRMSCGETSPTTAVLDADNTFGIAAAARAMEKSIELAGRQGMGCTVVKNSTHFGAAAIYAHQAARADMIGLCFTSVDALVFPFGAKRTFLGTNPFCFAAPCEGEAPFCLDMATSAISWNKLRQYKEKGLPLEPGWAADKEGKACTDVEKAAGLLPAGGYKGYGLGLVIEILCALLAGMPYGEHIPKMYPLNGEKRQLGHFLMALDVSRFVEVPVFKNRVRTLCDELRSLPAAGGFDRVMVAGDPEKAAYAGRTAGGIPVSGEEVKNFRRIAEKLGVDEKKYRPIFGA
ncbi:MAG: Ldh family oxidoreductase [Elusimicrobiota bacterium]